MPNLNKVLLMGNLTRDPEMRTTPNGLSVCNFGLAVNKKRKDASGNYIDETTFVDITAFGKTADTIGQYFAKGKPIFVEGELRLEKWQASDGSNRQKLSVTVNNFQFIESRQDGGNQGGYQQHTQQGYQSNQRDFGSF